MTIDSQNDPKIILSEFFYTISTNFSIYSFNEKDYYCPLNTNSLCPTALLSVVEPIYVL